MATSEKLFKKIVTMKVIYDHGFQGYLMVNNAPLV